MKIKTLVITALFILPAIASKAQRAGQVTDTLKIRSAYLNDEREVWVQKPNGYDTTRRDYPVLLLLDADGHFGYMKEYLAYLHNTYNKEVPAMVLVSVRSTRRTAILTPKTGDARYDTLAQRGEADQYLEFIEKELFPKLSEKYRINDFRILLGHSLGGLFGIYSLYKKPGFFRAVISASAAAGYASDVTLRKFLPSAMQQQYVNPTYLYLTVGDNDMQGFREANERLRDALTGGTSTNLKWNYKLMPGYNHWTVAPPSYYEGLVQMFLLPEYKSLALQ